MGFIKSSCTFIKITFNYELQRKCKPQTNIHRPERGDGTNQRACKQMGKSLQRIHTKKNIHRQTSTINVSHHAGPRHTERPSSSKHIKDHYICTNTVAMFTGCILCVGVRGCTLRTKLPKLTCTQTLIQFLTFKRTTLG